VLARVVEFDIPSNKVVLESPHGRNHRLTVDTRLLEAMPLTTNSLFQVIGELRRNEVYHSPSSENTWSPTHKIDRTQGQRELGAVPEMRSVHV
jgi:hypothetical protein